MAHAGLGASPNGSQDNDDANAAAIALITLSTDAAVNTPTEFLKELAMALSVATPPGLVEFAGLRTGSVQCKISVPAGYDTLSTALAGLKHLVDSGGHVIGGVTVSSLTNRVVKLQGVKADELRASLSQPKQR